MKPGILCTGSIALDTTRTPFKTVERVLGGSASYFSLAASFFSKVGVVSVVGNDFPKEHWDLLESKGVDLSGVQKKEGKTFFFDSSFDYSLYARTALKTELNVFDGFKPVVPENYQDAEFVYLGTIVPSEQASVLKQAKNCKLSFMDTIEFYINTDLHSLLETMKLVDGVVLNDVEARMLSKTSNLVTAGKTLQKMGPKIVIIKKGEHGCLLFFEDAVFPFPAFPLENVVDPTGAGDSFAGGLMGFLASKGEVSEKTLRQAIAFGTVMGSFAVEDYSVNRLTSVSRKEIDERLNSYKKLTSEY